MIRRFAGQSVQSTRCSHVARQASHDSANVQDVALAPLALPDAEKVLPKNRYSSLSFSPGGGQRSNLTAALPKRV